MVLDERVIGDKDALPCKFCDMMFYSCKELVKHKTKKHKGERVVRILLIKYKQCLVLCFTFGS